MIKTAIGMDNTMRGKDGQEAGGDDNNGGSDDDDDDHGDDDDDDDDNDDDIDGLVQDCSDSNAVTAVLH